MAFGVLTAYGVFRVGFALMRPRDEAAPVKVRPKRPLNNRIALPDTRNGTAQCSRNAAVSELKSACDGLSEEGYSYDSMKIKQS